MLISVIVPVRNGGAYLDDALRSIRAQTYSRYELIVVDGCSTDGSDLIAARFDPDKLIRQASPRLWDAFNLGIQAARGDCVAFLSSDDRWTPDKLAQQAAALVSAPELQVVLGLVQFFVEPGFKLPASYRPWLLDRPLAARQFECLLARRPVFEMVGTLDSAYGYGADVDWFMRLQAQNLPSMTLPEVMLYKRIHAENQSHENAARHQRYLLRILREGLGRRRHLPEVTHA